MPAQPFIWARVAGPTSYLSKNFKLPKCWTSEVQHPSCPISNFVTIQTVDIIFSLIREPACPPNLLNLFLDIFKSFPLFIMIKFWAFNILTSCRFRCKSATACVLHNFSNVLSDWYFSWFYLNFHWLSSSMVFFVLYILLGLSKKDREKILQRMFLQTQPDIFVHTLFKEKMQFFSVVVSWCDLLPLFL